MKKILLLISIYCITYVVFAEDSENKTKLLLAKVEILTKKMKAKLSKELCVNGIPVFKLIKDVKNNPSQFISTVPEHTRKRVLIITPEYETKITAATLDHYRKQNKIYSDPVAQEKVLTILKKLQTGLPNKILPAFYLLDDNDVNAWCLPDGTILVTRGAIKKLSANQMAAVLAHELGHGVARHGAEKITIKLLKNTAGVVLFNIPNDMLLKASIVIVYGLGSKYGFYLPYSRIMEYEADKLAILILARAGYDPQIMIDLLKDFEEQHCNAPWWEEYLSTHPLDKNRIKKALKVIKDLKLEK